MRSQDLQIYRDLEIAHIPLPTLSAIEHPGGKRTQIDIPGCDGLLKPDENELHFSQQGACEVPTDFDEYEISASRWKLILRVNEQKAHSREGLRQ